MSFCIFVDEHVPSPTFKNFEGLSFCSLRREVYKFFLLLLKAQGIETVFSFDDFILFQEDYFIGNSPEERESVVNIELDDGRNYSLSISEWNSSGCCCNTYLSITLIYNNSRKGSVIVCFGKPFRRNTK